MVAGALRDRVTFEREIETPDGGGGSTRAWGGGLTVWGHFRPERGRERLEAGRLQASLVGVLRVRSSTETSAITTEWSVIIAGLGGGERFQIRSIANPDRRNRFLEMTIERGVAQ